MDDPDRMVAWLRETLDAAEKVANAAARRAWSPHWEYDRSVHEIRDLNNGNTLANIYFPAIGKFSAANDPAAVLRQIDRHRKLLDDLERIVNGDYIDDGELPLAEHVIRGIAEGWGWTEETTTGE